jgi:hypothetical protein
MCARDAVLHMRDMKKVINGPLGIGIWNGELKDKASGRDYTGEHVAVFTKNDMVAAFGPRGDEESEACAAMFVCIYNNIEKIADAITAP